MKQNGIRACSWCFFLWWAACVNGLPAQDLSVCEIDLGPLKAAIHTDFSQARPGDVFYLDPAYLPQPDRQPVFEAQRPYRQATGGEMPLLYQPNKYFRGDFTPLETLPRLILPIGLTPLDVSAYEDVPFVLLGKEAHYLLFECQGRQVVAYADTMLPTHLFYSAAGRRALAEKRTYAHSLLGLEVQIPDNPGAARRFNDLELASCHVARDYVTFSYWAGEAGYFYVDAETRFHMYEKACVIQQNALAPPAAAGLSEEAEKQLNEIVREKNPVKRMQENPALMALLVDQFEIARDSYAGITWYLHKGLTPEQISKTSFVRANLNSNGILYLQSNCFSPEGMGHTMVEVSSGAEKTRSAAVAADDSRNLRVESEAGIEEQIHFTKGDDRDVIHFIAYHVENPITLTFLNEAGQAQSSLMPPAHKRAIRDTFVLYLLIRKE